MQKKNEAYFLVYSATFLQYEKYVSKQAGTTFKFIQLSLVSYIVISKHMCSNQAGGCFLVYSATFVIQEHVSSNKVVDCFF